MANPRTGISSHFSKKFEFKSLVKQNLLCSQPFENLPWEVEELQRLKESLNATKNLLNDKDIQVWHVHTAKTNHAGAIFQKVKKEINPELLTQAWLKFYECLCEYDLIYELTNIRHFSSLHLCEAPGAFITSLNHYLSLNCDNFEKLEWLATTLNPYYEGNSSNFMVDDDRFMLRTLANWDFGVDNTGDIMNPMNAQHLIQKLENRNIMMVTADGSINCVDNPGDQENRVSRLHWCELITALSVLSDGGTFLLKTFTFFEHMSVSLLYVLKTFFAELHAFKPCTSKEGNSEVYLIAIRFQKTEENSHFLKILQNWVYDKNVDFASRTLFSRSEIPADFLNSVIDCAGFFKEWQEKAILRNLALYNMPEDDGALFRLKHSIANRYFKRYRLKKITRWQQLIVAHKPLVAHWKMESGFQNNRSTLPRLLTNTHLHWVKLEKELNETYYRVNDISRKEWVPPENWKDSINLVVGKPFDQIENSKFCYSRILNIFSFVLKNRTGNNTENGAKILPFDKQRVLLDSFWSALNSLEEGQDFLLARNIPILSRFSVSSVWLIAHLFSKVEWNLEEDHYIKFVGYQNNTEIVKFLQELDHNLLSFIDIPELCRDPFYEMVFRYNTMVLIQHSLMLIGE